MEARETRREVIEAEGRVLRDGKIETIRHRAIVTAERLANDKWWVCSIRLVENPHGQYTRTEKSGRMVPVVVGGWGGLHRTVGIRNMTPLRLL